MHLLSKRTLLALICFVGLMGCEEIPVLDLSSGGSTDTDTLDSGSGDCTAQALTACHEGDIHWLDSCGELDGMQTPCNGNRHCIDTVADQPTCACRNEWVGDDCQNCPGNWDAAADCGVCQPGWAGAKCENCVRYVDAANILEASDGLDWETAFDSVQEAIDAAALTVEVDATIDSCEVWVKSGTYYVYQAAATDSIVLKEGVMLLGGFEGDETEADERQAGIYPTVLDGHHVADPSLQVATVVTVEVDTLIDGFVITGGWDDPGDLEWRQGAGMRIANSSPTIQACTFHGNAAAFGGAVYAENSIPRFVDCDFVQNESYISGGAIHANDCSSVEIVDSEFDQNASGFRGGALAFHNVAEASCRQCTFVENAANSGPVVDGGNLQHLVMENALVYDNVVQPTSQTPSLDGVGLIFEMGDPASVTSTIEVINSTLVENQPSTTAAGTPVLIAGADIQLEMTNSIIWGNAEPEACFPAAAGLDIRYSNLDCTGITGIGDIAEDPLFANSGGGNFELGALSPCIDSADGTLAPERDLLGAARVNDPNTPFTGQVSSNGFFADMGVYEHQPL